MIEINLNPFPELTTSRLLLRQLQMSDAEEIFLLRSDEKVNEFVERKRATSIEDARDYIDMITTNQNNGEGITWAITLKDDPKLLGVIVFWNFLKEKDEAEIGYELLPAYHGKGIVQEGLLKVIEYGFKMLKLKTIGAYPKSTNRPSVNLLEKCGFVETAATENGYLTYKLNSPL